MNYFMKILFLILLVLIFYNKYKKTFIKNNKKIALCFLIYEEINHEQLWYDFLKNIPSNKYNIYIHYKTNKPLKFFEKFKLKKTLDTCWGCLSIVLAQNLILKEALKDTNNQHFIWLSDSCIPLKSFSLIYNYLDTTKSYFNIAPDSQLFPRCDNLLKFLNKNVIKKAAMPSIINRKHAKLFVKNDNNIKKWFKNIDNVDEIIYITFLHHKKLQNELILTPNIAAGAIIFSQWDDIKNYKHFEKSKKINNSPSTYNYICPEELNYLIKSKSLFARKFTKNCEGLGNLIELISK